MSDFGFAAGFSLGCIISSVGVVIALIICRRIENESAQEIDGWGDAFAASRAHGHNTDAYTFQIAWAYARDYFERRAPASEGEQNADQA